MMPRRVLGVAWVLAALILASGCGQDGQEEFVVDDSLRADIRTLQSARVYFGHQSVGNNILAGVADILAETKMELPILDVNDSAEGLRGYILHSKVGKNQRPDTKCDDFQAIINDQLQGRVDIALLKFCYVDIRADSNLDEIFSYYQKTLDTLKDEYPEIVFTHVTVPLHRIDAGAKRWIKAILGKSDRQRMANLKREQFNRRLRDAYAADPIFDLAAAESTYVDGTRSAFSMDGEQAFSLIPAYTDDGGHLNHTGRRHLGAAFVRALARVVRERTY